MLKMILPLVIMMTGTSAMAEEPVVYWQDMTSQTTHLQLRAAYPKNRVELLTGCRAHIEGMQQPGTIAFTSEIIGGVALRDDEGTGCGDSVEDALKAKYGEPTVLRGEPERHIKTNSWGDVRADVKITSRWVSNGIEITLVRWVSDREDYEVTYQAHRVATNAKL